MLDELAKMKLASGHQVEKFSEEEQARRRRDFRGYLSEYIRLQPGQWCLPVSYLKYASRIYDFQFRTSDVVIMTWPKCGTTWLQEVVWTMKNNPNLDHPLAFMAGHLRIPFLEMDFILPPTKETCSTQDNPEFQRFQQLCPGQDPGDSLMLKLSEATPNPRIIKTHLPFSLLNPALLSTAKVVYVMRNPLDAVLSYSHHCKLFISQKFQGTIGDFVDHFLDNMLMYGPYHTHIIEAISQISHPNLHLIHFEDMKADFLGEVRRLDVFLGTKLTKEQCQNVMSHCSFSAMKGRGAAFGKEDKVEIFDKETLAKEGSFFREGKAGSWKTQLTPELETKIKDWMEMNLPDVPFKCNK